MANLAAWNASPARPDRDEKLYRLADGKELIGQTLWLRAQEIGGPRVLNYRFPAER